jgi:hypothetical protein
MKSTEKLICKKQFVNDKHRSLKQCGVHFKKKKFIIRDVRA